MHRALVAALAAVLAGGCASVSVQFPNATPGRPLTVPGWLSRPPGGGPFPALVLLHGCHGVSSSTHGWARWFRDHGYVALIVDSWAARNMAEGCSPQSVDLPNTERFDDAVGALRFLHSRAEVDRQRIGVIGWSNGGVFAIALINGPTHERARRRGVTLPEPGFRAAIGVYPGGCYSLATEQVVRPLLVLMGDADDWTLPGPCVEMVEAMRRRGADAAIVLYPGAVHYFDVEGQPRTYLSDVENRNKPGGCCGATVGSDAAAAADARRRATEFFGYHLR
jgi:dienelactone hydrolase